MRFSAAAMVMGSALMVPATVMAVRPPEHGAHVNALVNAEGVKSQSERDTTWATPAGAEARWAAFLEAEGGEWKALWDADTRVPLRIFGSGVAAPGASLSPEVAEESTRAIVARHLDLLAPGARMSDLELVANDFDPQSKLRTVAFEQRHRGQPVIGGQVSVRIRNDSVFVVASEAWPNVDVPKGKARLAPAEAVASALAWIAGEAESVALHAGPKAPAILPLRPEDGPASYRRVVEVVIDAERPVGRWSVYLDAATGAPVARRQTLRFVGGTVQVNAPVRHPESTRQDVPAAEMSAAVAGQSLVTDAQGVLPISGEEPVSVTLEPTGPEVNVDNEAGPRASVTAELDPNGTFTWDARDDELVDAQLNTFVASSVVKAYARNIAPESRWLNRSRLQATVNYDDTCNAFSDGVTINFFRASRRCQNTGRLADVVYHEFGHSFHAQSIIRGAGSFDNALSEGASDYIAATITNDNGMGRGFFYSNAPLRDVDEARDRVWPDDVSEVPHQTGLIFAGALWDLRKLLVQRFPSEAEGVAHTDQLWYQALRRSSDIPSSYVEILAADDDDGDLSNGTPNVCAINEAFALHGLADAASVSAPIGTPVLSGFELSVPVGEPPSECPGVSINAMTVRWQRRDDPSIQGTASLSASNEGFAAAIPEQPAGSVVQYQVEVFFDDGDRAVLPDNPADPYYETFIGEVVELYCTDFESDPEAEGWYHELLAGQPTEGADDWMWGEPRGTSGSGDPERAFSGAQVIGNDLGGGNYNGRYQADKQNIMNGPAIDTQRYPVVRLQYRRWLNVEDADYDRATILANGRPVWTNYATGDRGDTHHQDREWRFHDVDLTSAVVNDEVRVSFMLESDGGLEFGGWTIDDLCVVGFLPPGAALCGNGNVEEGEACDDGNRVDGDGCENDCTYTPGIAVCGNGVVDEGEACDDGNRVEDDGCQSDCTVTPTPEPMPPVDPETPGLGGGLEGEGSGCAATGRPGAGAVLALGLLGLLAMRRRR